MFVAERLCGAQELGCGRMDTAFTLDGFEHDGDGTLGDGGAQGVDVVELRVNEPRHDRAEAAVDFFLRCCAHSTEGSAMKAAGESDDFVTR